MLLIDYALLLGTGLIIYNGLNYLENFKNIKWDKLQKGLKIESHRIIENKKKDYGYKLTVELPEGG